MIEWLGRYAVGSLTFGLFILMADWASSKFGKRDKPMRHDAFAMAMILWPAAMCVFLFAAVQRLRGKK